MQGRTKHAGPLGLLLLLLSVVQMSCTQPPLIEGAALNDHRVQDLVRRASYASGLRVLRPLTVTLLNRTELQLLLKEAQALDAQSDGAQARKEALHAMGFKSAIGESLDANAHVLARSVTGIYLPRTQRLYLVNEHVHSPKGGLYLKTAHVQDDATLAHEIVHGLQHMHYPGLFEWEAKAWHSHTDAVLALQAAIEGDATLWSANSVGFQWGPRDPQKVIELSRANELDHLSDTPLLVRERLMFPYTYGYQFAYHQGRDGLRFPPASTEQVLHVERRPFQAIDLSGLSVLLNGRGCRVLFQDTMGEFTLSLWLRDLNFLVMQQAWIGWDGDRSLAAECGSARVIAWVTGWDTERDAQEFEEAFHRVAPYWQRHAELPSPLVAERHKNDVIIVSEELRPDVRLIRSSARRARVATRDELSAHFSTAHVK